MGFNSGFKGLNELQEVTFCALPDDGLKMHGNILVCDSTLVLTATYSFM